MSAADAGSVGFQASIIGDIAARHDEVTHVPDVERIPEPDERPDPRAQWDEVKGEWVVWDEADNEWEALDAEKTEDNPDT